MSDMQLLEVPPAPQYYGEIDEWTLRLAQFIETYLGEHARNIRFIYNGGPLPTLTIEGDLLFQGDGSGLPFGSCYGTGIAWSQAAAQNTWYNIVDSDIADGQFNGVAHDGNGKLTVTNAGRYLANWNITIKSGSANTYIEVGIEVSGSGSAEAGGQGHADMVTANKYTDISGTCICDLAASATVELSVRTTDAGNPTITVDDLNITLTYVGGT